jgi:WD40 repeat protein
MKLLELLITVQLQQPTDFVKCMSASDNRLACGTFDACIYLFEINTGRQVFRINKAHKATVSAISYDRDNTRIISGSFDKTVKIWNLDGSLIFEIGGFQ